MNTRQVIALTTDEAKLENMNSEIHKLLKNTQIDPVLKRGLYEDALKRISNFKIRMDHRQPPTVVHTTTTVEDQNDEMEFAAPVKRRREESDLPDIEMRTPSTQPVHPPLPSSPVPRLQRTTLFSKPRGTKRALTDYLSDKRKRNFATAMLSSQFKPPKMRDLGEEPELSGLRDMSLTLRPPCMPFEPQSLRRKKLPSLPKLLARYPTIVLHRGKKRQFTDVLLPNLGKRKFATALAPPAAKPPKISASNQSGDGSLCVSTWR